MRVFIAFLGIGLGWVFSMTETPSSRAAQKKNDDRVWLYVQKTGELFLLDKEGTQRPNKPVAKGYSGNKEKGGLNKPEKEAEKNVGPIPAGKWSIGEAFKHPSKGPMVMKLEPIGHKMAGRDGGFLIHGDNAKLNQTASEGCIILGPDIRKQIAESDIKVLIVVKE